MEIALGAVESFEKALAAKDASKEEVKDA